MQVIGAQWLVVGALDVAVSAVSLVEAAMTRVVLLLLHSRKCCRIPWTGDRS
jgi:hypothetical protein